MGARNRAFVLALAAACAASLLTFTPASVIIGISGVLAIIGLLVYNLLLARLLGWGMTIESFSLGALSTFRWSRPVNYGDRPGLSGLSIDEISWKLVPRATSSTGLAAYATGYRLDVLIKGARVKIHTVAQRSSDGRREGHFRLSRFWSAALHSLSSLLLLRVEDATVFVESAGVSEPSAHICVSDFVIQALQGGILIRLGTSSFKSSDLDVTLPVAALTVNINTIEVHGSLPSPQQALAQQNASRMRPDTLLLGIASGLMSSAFEPRYALSAVSVAWSVEVPSGTGVTPAVRIATHARLDGAQARSTPRADLADKLSYVMRAIDAVYGRYASMASFQLSADVQRTHVMLDASYAHPAESAVHKLSLDAFLSACFLLDRGSLHQSATSPSSAPVRVTSRFCVSHLSSSLGEAGGADSNEPLASFSMDEFRVALAGTILKSIDAMESGFATRGVDDSFAVDRTASSRLVVSLAPLVTIQRPLLRAHLQRLTSLHLPSESSGGTPVRPEEETMPFSLRVTPVVNASDCGVCLDAASFYIAAALGSIKCGRSSDSRALHVDYAGGPAPFTVSGSQTLSGSAASIWIALKGAGFATPSFGAPLPVSLWPLGSVASPQSCEMLALRALRLSAVCERETVGVDVDFNAPTIFASGETLSALNAAVASFSRRDLSITAQRVPPAGGYGFPSFSIQPSVAFSGARLVLLSEPLVAAVGLDPPSVSARCQLHSAFDSQSPCLDLFPGLKTGTSRAVLLLAVGSVRASALASERSARVSELSVSAWNVNDQERIEQPHQRVHFVWLDSALVVMPRNQPELCNEVTVGALRAEWSPASHLLLLQSYLAASKWLYDSRASPAVPRASTGLSSRVAISMVSLHLSAVLSPRSQILMSAGTCQIQAESFTGEVRASIAASSPEINVAGFESPVFRAAQLRFALARCSGAELSCASAHLSISGPWSVFFSRSLVFGDVVQDAKEAHRLAFKASAALLAHRSSMLRQDSPPPSALDALAFTLDFDGGGAVEWEEIDGATCAAHDRAHSQLHNASVSLKRALETAGSSVPQCLTHTPEMAAPLALGLITVSSLFVQFTWDVARHTGLALMTHIASSDSSPDTRLASRSTVPGSFDCFGTDTSCSCYNPLANGLRDALACDVAVRASGFILGVREGRLAHGWAAHFFPLAGRSRPLLTVDQADVNGTIAVADLLPSAGELLPSSVQLTHTTAWFDTREGPLPHATPHAAVQIRFQGRSAGQAVPPTQRVFSLLCGPVVHSLRASTPTKLYHDVSISLSGVHVEYGPGREVDLQAFATAAARLMPSSFGHAYEVPRPDGPPLVVCAGAEGAPLRPAPLKWWDRARFYAHGRLRLNASRLSVDLVAPPPLVGHFPQLSTGAVPAASDSSVPSDVAEIFPRSPAGSPPRSPFSESDSASPSLQPLLPDWDSQVGFRICVDVFDLLSSKGDLQCAGDGVRIDAVSESNMPAPAVLLTPALDASASCAPQNPAAGTRLSPHGTATFPLLCTPAMALHLSVAWLVRGSDPYRHYVQLPGARRELEAHGSRMIVEAYGDAPTAVASDPFLPFRSTGFHLHAVVRVSRSRDSIQHVTPDIASGLPSPPPPVFSLGVAATVARLSEAARSFSQRTIEASRVMTASPAGNHSAEHPFRSPPASFPESALPRSTGSARSSVPGSRWWASGSLPAHVRTAVPTVAVELASLPSVVASWAALSDQLPFAPITPIDLGLDPSAPHPRDAPSGLGSSLVTLFLDVEAGSDASRDYESYTQSQSLSTPGRATRHGPPAQAAVDHQPQGLELAVWSRKVCQVGTLLSVRRAKGTWLVQRRPMPPHAGSNGLPVWPRFSRLPAGFELSLSDARACFAPVLATQDLRHRAADRQRLLASHRGFIPLAVSAYLPARLLRGDAKPGAEAGPPKASTSVPNPLAAAPPTVAPTATSDRAESVSCNPPSAFDAFPSPFPVAADGFPAQSEIVGAAEEGAMHRVPGGDGVGANRGEVRSSSNEVRAAVYTFVPHPLRRVPLARAAYQASQVYWSTSQVAEAVRSLMDSPKKLLSAVNDTDMEEGSMPPPVYCSLSIHEQALLGLLPPDAPAAGMQPAPSSVLPAPSCPEIVVIGHRHVWTVPVREATYRLVDDVVETAAARNAAISSRPFAQSLAAASNEIFARSQSGGTMFGFSPSSRNDSEQAVDFPAAQSRALTAFLAGSALASAASRVVAQAASCGPQDGPAPASYAIWAHLRSSLASDSTVDLASLLLPDVTTSVRQRVRVGSSNRGAADQQLPPASLGSPDGSDSGDGLVPTIRLTFFGHQTALLDRASGQACVLSCPRGTWLVTRAKSSDGSSGAVDEQGRRLLRRTAVHFSNISAHADAGPITQPEHLQWPNVHFPVDELEIARAQQLQQLAATQHESIWGSATGATPAATSMGPVNEAQAHSVPGPPQQRGSPVPMGTISDVRWVGCTYLFPQLESDQGTGQPPRTEHTVNTFALPSINFSVNSQAFFLVLGCVRRELLGAAVDPLLPPQEAVHRADMRRIFLPLTWYRRPALRALRHSAESCGISVCALTIRPDCPAQFDAAAGSVSLRGLNAVGTVGAATLIPLVAATATVSVAAYVYPSPVRTGALCSLLERLEATSAPGSGGLLVASSPLLSPASPDGHESGVGVPAQASDRRDTARREKLLRAILQKRVETILAAASEHQRYSAASPSAPQGPSFTSPVATDMTGLLATTTSGAPLPGGKGVLARMKLLTARRFAAAGGITATASGVAGAGDGLSLVSPASALVAEPSALPPSLTSTTVAGPPVAESLPFRTAADDQSAPQADRTPLFFVPAAVVGLTDSRLPWAAALARANAEAQVSPVRRRKAGSKVAADAQSAASVASGVVRLRTVEYGAGSIQLRFLDPVSTQPVLEASITALRGEHVFHQDGASRVELDVGAAHVLQLASPSSPAGGQRAAADGLDDPMDLTESALDETTTAPDNVQTASLNAFLRPLPILSALLLDRPMSPSDRLIHVLAVTARPQWPLASALSSPATEGSLLDALGLSQPAADTIRVNVYTHLEASLLPGAEHALTVHLPRDVAAFLSAFFFTQQASDLDQGEEAPAGEETVDASRRASKPEVERAVRRRAKRDAQTGNRPDDGDADIDRAVPRDSAAMVVSESATLKGSIGDARGTSMVSSSRRDRLVAKARGLLRRGASRRSPEALDTAPRALDTSLTSTQGGRAVRFLAAHGKSLGESAVGAATAAATAVAAYGAPEFAPLPPGGSADDPVHRRSVTGPAEPPGMSPTLLALDLVPTCRHVLVPYLRTTTRTAMCVACGHRLPKFRKEVFRCVKCGVRVHLGCAESLLAQAAIGDEPLMSALPALGPSSNVPAALPAMLSRPASPSPPARDAPAPEPTESVEAVAIATAHAPSPAAGADPAGTRSYDTPHATISVHERDDEDAWDRFDGGWGLFTVSAAAAAAGTATRATGGALASGALPSDFLFLRYVRIGHVSLRLTLTGFPRLLNVHDLPLPLRPVTMHTSLVTWDALFLKLRRHVRNQVWAALPNIVRRAGRAVGVAAVAGVAAGVGASLSRAKEALVTRKRERALAAALVGGRADAAEPVDGLAPDGYNPQSAYAPLDPGESAHTHTVVASSVAAPGRQADRYDSDSGGGGTGNALDIDDAALLTSRAAEPPFFRAGPGAGAGVAGVIDLPPPAFFRWPNRTLAAMVLGTTASAVESGLDGPLHHHRRTPMGSGSGAVVASRLEQAANADLASEWGWDGYDEKGSALGHLSALLSPHAAASRGGHAIRPSLGQTGLAPPPPARTRAAHWRGSPAAGQPATNFPASAVSPPPPPLPATILERPGLTAVQLISTHVDGGDSPRSLTDNGFGHSLQPAVGARGYSRLDGVGLADDRESASDGINDLSDAEDRMSNAGSDASGMWARSVGDGDSVSHHDDARWESEGDADGHALDAPATYADDMPPQLHSAAPLHPPSATSGAAGGRVSRLLQTARSMASQRDRQPVASSARPAARLLGLGSASVSIGHRIERLGAASDIPLPPALRSGGLRFGLRRRQPLVNAPAEAAAQLDATNPAGPLPQRRLAFSREPVERHGSANEPAMGSDSLRGTVKAFKSALRPFRREPAPSAAPALITAPSVQPAPTRHTVRGLAQRMSSLVRNTSTRTDLTPAAGGAPPQSNAAAVAFVIPPSSAPQAAEPAAAFSEDEASSYLSDTSEEAPWDPAMLGSQQDATAAARDHDIDDVYSVLHSGSSDGGGFHSEGPSGTSEFEEDASTSDASVGSSLHEAHPLGNRAAALGLRHSSIGARRGPVFGGPVSPSAVVTGSFRLPVRRDDAGEGVAPGVPRRRLRAPTGSSHDLHDM